MQMNSLSKKSPLSLWRVLLLLVHYFIGYLFLYPMILTKITLYLDPNALAIPDSFLFMTYVFMVISTIWIILPVWKESHQLYLEKRPNLIWSNIKLLGMLLFVSIVLGMLVSVFSGETNSVNEQVVLYELKRSPLISLFSILIYSPIVEECVFRGGIYRTLRSKCNVLVSMLITGIVFGGIHVLDSLLIGNWNDVWFLFVYGGVSTLLCYSYEKNETLYSSVLLHFMNNLLAIFL